MSHEKNERKSVRDSAAWEPDVHALAQRAFHNGVLANLNWERSVVTRSGRQLVPAGAKGSGRSRPTKEPASSQPLSRAAEMFQGQLHPKKQKKIVRVEQWVEVRIVDGKTVTTCSPANEQVIRRGQGMLPPPEYVYRRFNFPDGIPNEYAWVTNNPEQRTRGGCGIQRMTIETWLEVVDREKLRGDGHLGPTGVGNLPRPEQHGECECPVCVKNSAILREREMEGL